MIDYSGMLLDVESFDDVPMKPFIRKWVPKDELVIAKKKLYAVLHEDLRMNPRWANKAVDHILAIKALYNARYAPEYIEKLLSRQKLVEELYQAKIKLKARNKEYARASNTISDLRGKLARFGVGR